MFKGQCKITLFFDAHYLCTTLEEISLSLTNTHTQPLQIHRAIYSNELVKNSPSWSSWYLIILSFYVLYSLALQLEMAYSHISVEDFRMLIIHRERSPRVDVKHFTMWLLKYLKVGRAWKLFMKNPMDYQVISISLRGFLLTFLQFYFFSIFFLELYILLVNYKSVIN